MTDKLPPLLYLSKKFSGLPTLQERLSRLFPNVNGAIEIQDLLNLMSNANSRARPHDNVILSLCAAFWADHPSHLSQIATIALSALARANDPKIETANALKEYIADFADNPGAQKDYKRIQAIKRAKQSYYFHTKYQALDIERLEAQFLKNRTIVPVHQAAAFTCIGSCFASNLGGQLKARGIEDIIAYRYQDNTDPVNVLVAMVHTTLFKERIKNAEHNVVIMTAGFAETGRDDDDVGPGALKRFLTPEAVADAIVRVRVALNTYKPSTRLFVSVSPVPLEATASEFSPYEANAISKSIMRLGVAQACNQIEGIEYFPAYELITQHFPFIGEPPTQDDPFHHREQIILAATNMFMQWYTPWIDLTQRPALRRIEIINMNPDDLVTVSNLG